MTAERTYKGWTVEKRLRAVHWLLVAVWLTQIICTLLLLIALVFSPRAYADPTPVPAPALCGYPDGAPCAPSGPDGLTPGCLIVLWRTHFPLYPWCNFQAS